VAVKTMIFAAAMSGKEKREKMVGTRAAVAAAAAAAAAAAVHGLPWYQYVLAVHAHE
jgi:hypothetical protein